MIVLGEGSLVSLRQLFVELLPNIEPPMLEGTAKLQCPVKNKSQPDKNRFSRCTCRARYTSLQPRNQNPIPTRPFWGLWRNLDPRVVHDLSRLRNLFWGIQARLGPNYDRSERYTILFPCPAHTSPGPGSRTVRRSMCRNGGDESRLYRDMSPNILYPSS